MRMHKNILGGGHLLGNNYRVARRHRCAGAGRPLPAHGSRRAFRLANAPRVVATGASLALILLVGALLFPTTPDSAHAEETGTKATLTINPVLSLGLDSAVTMSVQPTSTGEFTSGSAALTVSTNNETGYSLYLSTANGKSTLDSINPATATAVQPVSGTVAAENFGANTWGYNLGKDAATDDTTYQAVPTTASAPQATTAGPTLGDGTLAADTYSLNFGALINSDLPSGTYTNTVTVSVVTNPAYIPSFEGIETMQEMTPTICSNADEGETARLKDARDDKLYWVTKLKDGNCWMTQNLDLDLKASEPLTSADSDISESRGSWTPTDTQNNTTGFSDYYGTQSFDPGMYVNNDPTAWTSCNNYWSGGSCSNWTEVSSMTAMTEERTDGTIINGNTYDAHYLAGNYYQWNAATAGTGGSDIKYQDTNDSICPKGWKLPTSDNSNPGSFGGLTSVYGISGNSAGATALTKSPLYFVPAGELSIGSLGVAGSAGEYWSSRAHNSTLAYQLFFGPNSVNPSLAYNRYQGRSVRCLAR